MLLQPHEPKTPKVKPAQHMFCLQVHSSVAFCVVQTVES